MSHLPTGYYDDCSIDIRLRHRAAKRIAAYALDANPGDRDAAKTEARELLAALGLVEEQADGEVAS